MDIKFNFNGAIYKAELIKLFPFPRIFFSLSQQFTLYWNPFEKRCLFFINYFEVNCNAGIEMQCTSEKYFFCEIGALRPCRFTI